MERSIFMNSILLVEDDDSIREMLQIALEFEGYRVRTASNGKEGLKVLATTPPPCLVLLDLTMPVMNGWEFARELRNDDVFDAVPIVIVTAFGEHELPAQAESVITKPVDLDSLLECVKKHCGGK